MPCHRTSPFRCALPGIRDHLPRASRATVDQLPVFTNPESARAGRLESLRILKGREPLIQHPRVAAPRVLPLVGFGLRPALRYQPGKNSGSNLTTRLHADALRLAAVSGVEGGDLLSECFVCVVGHHAIASMVGRSGMTIRARPCSSHTSPMNVASSSAANRYRPFTSPTVVNDVRPPG